MFVQGAKLSFLQYFCAFCAAIFLVSGAGSIALGQSGDEAILRSMTARYFEFYQKKDVNGLLQMWNDKSPDYAATQQSLQKTFAETDKLEVKNLSIAKVSIEGDKAGVRVAFELSAIETKSGKPAPGSGKQNRTVSFSRVGKQWQVWRVISSEEELAAMVGASQTDEERKAIIESNQELLTAEFIRALNKYGRQQFDQGETAQAVTLYNFAVTIAEKIGDLSGKSDALRLIGLYHVRQGRLEQALQYYKDSLNFAKEAGDKEMAARAFNSLGGFHYRRGEFEQALEYYQEVKKIAEELQDDSLLLFALTNFALVYQALGKNVQSLDAYTRALPVARKLGDKRQISVLMVNIGDNYRLSGDYDEALVYYLNAMTFAEQNGFKSEMMIAAFGAGAAYDKKGMYAKAIEEYEKASIFAETLGAKAQIARLKTAMGVVKQAQGDYALVLQLNKEALKVAYELKDQVLISTILINMSQTYYQQGDYVKALDYIQQSLILSEQIGDQEGVAIALNAIGIMYDAQANYPQSLKYYQRSLLVAEQLKNQTEIVNVLLNIGLAYIGLEDYPKALRHLEDLLILSNRLGNKGFVLQNLQHIGDVYNAQQNPAKALDYYLEALKIAEEIQNRQLLSEILRLVGTIHYQQKDYTKALEYANRASSIARQINTPIEIWYAKLLAGKVYRALNQNDQALQSFSESISMIEKLRAQLTGGEQERQRFFNNKSEAYNEIIELLLVQNQPAQALAYAEQFRGRVLLDTMQSGRINVSKAMTTQEQEKERKFRSELISLNSQINHENQKEKSNETLLKDLNFRLQKTRQEYEDFQFILFAAHPELKTQRGNIQPVTLADVEELLPDGKTALLEFVVKEEKAFLFVLTRKTSLQKTLAKQVDSPADHVDLQVYPMNIKQKDLQGLTQNFVKAISIRSAGYKESAAKLYDTLLKPAQAQLKNLNNLVIVPDNVLWELPFQALQSAPNRFLVQDYAISYAPSLTVLREMNKKKKERHQAERNDAAGIG